MSEDEKKPLADNVEGLKKSPEDVEKEAEAARAGTSPIGLAQGEFRQAGSKVVGIDPARAPMQDERKELAHSTIVEGEREEQADTMKKRGEMHAEAVEKSKHPA